MTKRIAVFLALLFCTTLAGAQSFRGPYVGGYIAGADATANWQLSNGNKTDHSISGGLVGVQGGYNWNPPGWLLGVQGDIGVGDVSGSSRCPNVTFECKTELLSLLTVRGRVGPAFDNFALYATAGVASAGIRSSVDNHLNSKDDDTQGHAGWTAGVGVTGIFARHVQWQVEYLHADFGSEDHVLQGLPTSVKVKMDTLRVGFHYKFF